ncbi:MAG: hypothetical protein IJH60_01545 [Eubacterium sp.]|nr:hypothetical protein [Eubacterium sp.]
MNVTGVISVFRYPLAAILLVFAGVVIYTFISMAAFEDSLPHLMRNAVFFMVKNPIFVLILIFFNIFPMYLTYSDPQMMPLYAFIWVSCGFGLQALLGSVLVLPIMKPYLPMVDDLGFFILDENGNKIIPAMQGDKEDQEPSAGAYEGHKDPSEAEILEMMKKMGM